MTAASVLCVGGERRIWDEEFPQSFGRNEHHHYRSAEERMKGIPVKERVKGLSSAELEELREFLRRRRQGNGDDRGGAAE